MNVETTSVKARLAPDRPGVRTGAGKSALRSTTGYAWRSPLPNTSTKTPSPAGA